MRRVLLLVGSVSVTVIGATVAYGVLRDREYQRQLGQGDEALRAEQTVSAIEYYSGAVVLRPDSMLARLRRGEAYQRRGDLEAALRDFRDAAALDSAAIDRKSTRLNSSH